MDVEDLFKKRAAGFHRRILALIVMVGGAVAIAIYSSYRLGNRMVERYTPLMDSVMELQIHATTSHLWFEELLSGDRSVDIATIYQQLDIADKYAELMLGGGAYESVTYQPMRDEGMITQVNAVKEKLHQYRTIVDRRWEMRDGSGPGSEIDEELDRLFNEMLIEANTLELQLQNMLRESKRSFYLTHILLLFLVLAITFAVGWMVRRLLLRQAYGVHLLERTNIELSAEVEKRKRTEALLEKQASTDHLTGILNRSRMSELLLEEWNRVIRYPESFSLILFDIDHFKQVNDKLGHQAGDRVLVELTHRVKKELRDIDAFARWGGEEFLILLPKTSLKGAREVAERCRMAFVNTRIQGVGAVTASFSVVEYSRDDESLQHMLKRADAILYAAKKAGRDCIRTEIPSS